MHRRSGEEKEALLEEFQMRKDDITTGQNILVMRFLNGHTRKLIYRRQQAGRLRMQHTRHPMMVVMMVRMMMMMVVMMVIMMMMIMTIMMVVL